MTQQGTTTKDKAAKLEEFRDRKEHAQRIENKSLYAWGKFHKDLTGALFLLDTGAEISILNKVVYDEIPFRDRPPLIPVNGTVNSASCEDLPVYGAARLTIDFEGVEVTHEFWVCDTIEHGIIGVDLLKQQEATLDVGRRRLFLGKKCVQLRASTGRPLQTKVVCAQVVHLPPRQECIIMARVSKGRKASEGTQAQFEPAQSLYLKSGAVAACAMVRGDVSRIPVRVFNPGSEVVTVNQGSTLGILRHAEEMVLSGPEERRQRQQEAYREAEIVQDVRLRDWDAEPRHTVSGITVQDAPPHVKQQEVLQAGHGTEGIKGEHPTTEGGDTTKETSEVSPPSEADAAGMIDNNDSNGDTATTGSKAHDTDPAEVEGVSADEVLRDSRDEDEESRQLAESLPVVVRGVYRRSTVDMTTIEKHQVAKLLSENADVFATTPDGLGRTTWVQHDIDTGTARPVCERVRRHAYEATQEMEKEVERLREMGILKESNSQWASNVVLVRRRDGSCRMCVDFRGLNLVTTNDEPLMLPRLAESIGSLKQATYFSVLDVLLGFHQIELTERAKEKTAVIVPRMVPNQWQFECMTYGLHGTPRTFQLLLNRVIQELPVNVAMTYLDDVVVFSTTLGENIIRLQLVFEKLRAAGLKLRGSTCKLFQRQIVFRGHLIDEQGVTTDPDRVSAVLSWKPCRTPKQVQAFLGMVTYYSEYIEDFAVLAEPLMIAERQRSQFEWTSECQNAFELLKEKLTSAPIMAHPVDDGLYILDTDASGHAIGAVLSQRQKDEEGKEVEKVIAYGSRRLHPREMNYCIRRKEMLAMVDFVRHFRSYLFGQKALLRTDHASLQYIRTMKEPTEQMFRWIGTLEGILQQYDIEIRKGIHHSNADGLSRMGCEGKTCICHGVYEQDRKVATETTVVMRVQKEEPCESSGMNRVPMPKELMARGKIGVEDYGPIIDAVSQGHKVLYEELPVNDVREEAERAATKEVTPPCDDCDGADYSEHVPHPADHDIMPTFDCPGDDVTEPGETSERRRIDAITFNEPRRCEDMVEGVDPELEMMDAKALWKLQFLAAVEAAARHDDDDVPEDRSVAQNSREAGDGDATEQEEETDVPELCHPLDGDSSEEDPVGESEVSLSKKVVEDGCGVTTEGEAKPQEGETLSPQVELVGTLNDGLSSEGEGNDTDGDVAYHDASDAPATVKKLYKSRAKAKDDVTPKDQAMEREEEVPHSDGTSMKKM